MFGEWNVEDWKVIPNEARPNRCSQMDKFDLYTIIW